MKTNFTFKLGPEWTSNFSSPEATFYIHSRTLGTSGTVSSQVNNLGLKEKGVEDTDSLRNFIVDFTDSQGCGDKIVKESKGITSDAQFTFFAIEDDKKLQTLLWLIQKDSEHALIVYMNSEGVDAEEMKHVEESVIASSFSDKPWWKIW